MCLLLFMPFSPSTAGNPAKNVVCDPRIRLSSTVIYGFTAQAQRGLKIFDFGDWDTVLEASVQEEVNDGPQVRGDASGKHLRPGKQVGEDEPAIGSPFGLDIRDAPDLDIITAFQLVVHDVAHDEYLLT
jgi:hypothetical protein